MHSSLIHNTPPASEPEVDHLRFHRQHEHLSKTFGNDVRWSSNFGHNDRFPFCHFLFVDRGRQIA